MISLWFLSLWHPDHRAVEQGTINLAYFFSDDLWTILDHHLCGVDLSLSNAWILMLNTYLKLIYSMNFLWCEFDILKWPHAQIFATGKALLYLGTASFFSWRCTGLVWKVSSVPSNRSSHCSNKCSTASILLILRCQYGSLIY